MLLLNNNFKNMSSQLSFICCIYSTIAGFWSFNIIYSLHHSHFFKTVCSFQGGSNVIPNSFTLGHCRFWASYSQSGTLDTFVHSTMPDILWVHFYLHIWLAYFLQKYFQKYQEYVESKDHLGALEILTMVN